MKAFWTRLSDREKLFVGAGGAIAAVLIFIMAIVSPAMNWRAAQAQKKDAAQDLYRLVNEASGNAGVAAAGVGADFAKPLLNVLTDTTGEFAITVNYRNARPDGAVEANVAAASENLFKWLRALDERYGVTVAAADISRSPSGEEAQAQVTLIRRAAP